MGVIISKYFVDEYRLSGKMDHKYANLKMPSVNSLLVWGRASESKTWGSTLA